MHREITPEDYDMLMKLEESVPKKTASAEQADQLVSQRETQPTELPSLREHVRFQDSQRKFVHLMQIDRDHQN